jgi:hypothetical protein
MPCASLSILAPCKPLAQLPLAISSHSRVQLFPDARRFRSLRVSALGLRFRLSVLAPLFVTCLRQLQELDPQCRVGACQSSAIDLGYTKLTVCAGAAVGHEQLQIESIAGRRRWKREKEFRQECVQVLQCYDSARK